MTASRPARAHLIAGGFPPGSSGGHDHDYVRLRLLEMLAEQEIPASVSSDFGDVEKWLPVSRLLVTYVAGPFPDAEQTRAIRQWIQDGGRWLGLHGTSGGKAARIEGIRQRRMVKMEHHELLGGFFINHPPMRRFRVDVGDAPDKLTDGLPESFEVIDEPYMIEVQDPASTRVLLTAEIGPDSSPEGFGFVYDEDTALMPDGKTRVMGYSREVGSGGVTYIALGHAHNPQTNAQPVVDASVTADGTRPGTLHQTWETAAYQTLLRNSLVWGMG